MVPDLATFAVDDGFAYSIPDGLRVEVGSLVRVPLGGRTVRGFVVDVKEGSPEGLKPLRGVSGQGPVFGGRLLEVLRWAARHYVAPVAVLLGRSAPPNLPPGKAPAGGGEVEARGSSPVPAVTEASAGGKKVPAVYLLQGSDPGVWLPATVGPVLRAGRSVLLMAPTGAEVEMLASDARGWAAERLVPVLPDLSDRDTTECWAIAAHRPGALIIGTPRVALWPVAGLGLAVIVEEGRRAMKDRQTPTLHVREVLGTRARVERLNLLFVGQMPSSELVAAGVEVVRPPGRSRAWPLVEVVDRSDDPPGSGLVTGRARLALRHTLESGGRAFVFTHRRGYAPAFRCASCRRLCRCPGCGYRSEPGTGCPRCGTELGACPDCGAGTFEPLGAGVGRVTEELLRVLGSGRVAAAPEDAPVRVGTERDLAGLAAVDLAVVVDADGLALGSNYRAAEEALRV
ncbi:MAG: hypothetical protein ACRDVM_05460, partial [Acidimicrobiia bacterium]